MNSKKRFRKTISAIIAYSVCSISMIMLNKLIMNTYKLNFPNSLLLLQNSGALLLIMLAKSAKFIDCPNLNRSVSMQWIIPTIAFVGMLFSSMRSLELMSVSAQTVIKNLAIILTATGDYWLYNKRLNTGIFFSFGLLIAGSYLCAKGDPWVTPWGLFWTFVNIISTVCYMLNVKMLSDRVGKQIGRYGPTLYSNLFSLPFLLIMGHNEFREFLNALGDASWEVMILLALMIFVSAHMAFTVFFCMEMTSPTTFSVVGTLNKVPIAILGILVFRQYPDLIGYVGIAVALTGGFMYTFFNIKSRRGGNDKTPIIERGDDNMIPPEKEPKCLV
ncbi:unnamed protein product [Phytomonas sp. EM1]|nr:unnamed protein product [Phytomonas sp. EM1]|eukprot:CCW60706.1 unnamed protein product [Phytomonas sp. isolate EM1]